jgi:tRNA(Arg) A34 adenosine deaminase TadA
MVENFMKLAIDEAILNIDRGGGPFGAIIVKDGRIISCCGNRVTRDNDPTAHAEILAIREASAVLGTWDLSDCEIYTSCEPCPMCLGAIYWARIPSIFYGANRDDAKKAGFDDSDIYNEMIKEPGKRKIKFHNVMRQEALNSFSAWLKYSRKEMY